MVRGIISTVIGGVLVGSLLLAPGVAAARSGPVLESSRESIRGHSSALTLRLPDGVAAVDGRVLVDKTAAPLIGIAPVGGGEALTPIETADGFAFGAYGLRSVNGRTSVRLVFAPRASGVPEVRVRVDSAANAQGAPISLSNADMVAEIKVVGSTGVLAAPTASDRPVMRGAAGPARDLTGRGVIAPEDVDLARSAWYQTRVAGTACTSGAKFDANNDGCIDAVDLQALVAEQGRATRTQALPGTRERGAIDTRFVASIGGMSLPEPDTADANLVFIVDSTADTSDATPGNGACADSQGRCTLRAALTESNWQSGVDRIHFNLPGAAPVRIQVGSALPPVGAANGGVIIDGYTQPGSQPNTAQFGTNATPGVEIRGTGNSMSYAVYVPRAGSTLRGLLINNSYSGIFVDTTSAIGNRIVGNFIGFNPDNSLTPRGRAGIWLNNGANGTIIGTPALADRNLIGNADKGVYSYGAGTGNTVIQNNVLCIRPTGLGALCQIGADHDFGPKNTLIGGAGPNERNVIGPTTLNGIEFSHGWDPATGQNTVTWQVNNNRAIGNWIGFRLDGHYDPNYRVATNAPTFDNGQGINIYDGSNNNLAEGNYIGSAHDGFTIGLSNSVGNTVRNNVVGQSPHGELFTPNGWGIYIYSNTRQHTVEGNLFYNTVDGGVGLIDFNDQQIRITRNLVFNTNGPAIYLAPNPDNPSTGANSLLASPVIAQASVTQASGTGIPGATVELYRASRNFGQEGLPIAFLGSAVAAGDGTWSITYSSALQTGDRISALQIRTNGDTSELSANVYAGGPPPPPVASFDSAQQPATLRVDFSDTSTGSPTAWSWNFGDGTSSTQQNPSHTYGTGGAFTVSLTVTNVSGSDAESRVISVAALPPGTVLAADSFSRTSSGTWDNADPGGPYALEANLGNYSIGNGVGVMLLPGAFTNRAALLDQVVARDVDARFRVRTNKTAAGNQFYVYAPVRRNGSNAYNPKLIIFPNGSVAVHAGVLLNNIETSLAPAIVVPGLTHTANSFLWLRTEVTGASPTTIRVKAWADGQTEPVNWQFTATNSSSAVQVAGGVGIRAYIDAVSNSPVTFNFDDYLVKTPGNPPPPLPPVANFNHVQQSSTLLVSFTDTSTGSPTSWSWNFGDGTSSTQQNPSKTYAAAGAYSVTLTATNASGSNSVTKTVAVNPLPPPPDAEFNFSQQSGTFQVSFTDASTGSPTSWSWNFGDGTSSILQSPSKTYGAAGDYSVTLTATNAFGSTSETHTVHVVPPPAPDAEFTFNQLAGTLRVNFSDASSGGATAWSWDFGDGTSSTAQNPVKDYAAGGDYSVTLTATNAGGSNSETHTVSVVVPQPPVADFTFSQQSGTLQVNFTDTSTGTPTSWSWNFGDGTTSTLRNPSKLFAVAGNHIVTLTATNAGGSNSDTQTVNVVSPVIVYASDAFGRTIATGWGGADTGGNYALEGTNTNFGVGNGVGSMTLPTGGATRAVFLNGVSARDVDVRLRVRTNKVAAGGTQYVYAFVRSNGNNAYRPKITLNTNGSVSVHCGVLINNSETSIAPAVTVPGLTYSANGFIWMRAQVVGTGVTTIRIKAWADGQPEPAAWQFTATNSAAAVQGNGSVGLRVYMSGGTTNAPVTFGFDDYSVIASP